jgi:hypothetical protein
LPQRKSLLLALGRRPSNRRTPVRKLRSPDLRQRSNFVLPQLVGHRALLAAPTAPMREQICLTPAEPSSSRISTVPSSSCHLKVSASSQITDRSSEVVYSSTRRTCTGPLLGRRFGQWRLPPRLARFQPLALTGCCWRQQRTNGPPSRCEGGPVWACARHAPLVCQGYKSIAEAAATFSYKTLSESVQSDLKLGGLLPRSTGQGNHRQADALKRMAAGESCRAIGRTMGAHHATIARLAA